MAGYDPQRNRARHRPDDSVDEPAPVDALLGPGPTVTPDPVPVAVNDDGPVTEPVVDLRAVPDPEPVTEPAEDPVAETEPEPAPEPPLPASASMPKKAGSPAKKLAAGVAALLAVLLVLVAWARRRSR